MKERIIVTLTTWSKRIRGIPTVLDTIFAQSIPPDLVVLNLAFEEQIPKEVQEYIDTHSIEVNRVVDTKVYKKLLPTLKKYPDDCIISIDDDWLYPQGMIEDFINMHKRYPQNPVSGNQCIMHQFQCHCGCASLVKASYFGDYLDCIDDEVISSCPSDDVVYTYFANKAGHPYLRTDETYFTNMTPYNMIDSYSKTYVKGHGNETTFLYLTSRFGQLKPFVFAFIEDPNIAMLIHNIYKQSIVNEYQRGIKNGIKKMENIYLSSYTFLIGSYIIKPIIWMKNAYDYIRRKKKVRPNRHSPLM